MNVANMLGIIASIPDPMILESLLPDLHIRAELLPGAKGEAPFDELNRLLQACNRRDEDMDVVGHDDKFMQKISVTSVAIESLDEEFFPSIGIEKRTTPPGLRCTM